MTENQASVLILATAVLIFVLCVAYGAYHGLKL